METINTYCGHVKNGQIALDQPVVLPEGAEVSVRLRSDASPPSARPLSRRQILQMPVEQRRQLLMRQSDGLAETYLPDPQRAEWQGGDFLE
jgi:hypothetical protein